jgi:hypothetical protein
MKRKQPTGPNLTQVTHVGRLAVKYGMIALVVLIVGRIFLTAAINYWKAMNPPPQPPPTIGFGPLPKIEFPDQEDEDKPNSYILELPTARFPEFPDRAKVFFMPSVAPSLLADELVRQKASSFKFVFQPEILGERTYRWTRTEDIDMSLTMDTLNYNFSLRSNFKAKPEFLINPSLPEEFEAVAKVKSVLDRADLLADDVATASGKVSFIRSLGGELTSAASLSDSDFIRVDLNRVPVDDKYPMYTSEGTRGTISAILTGATNTLSGVVEIDNFYHPIDYEQVETYPLRDVKMAWKVLQAGEGYVSSKGELEAAMIRDVELGYYDSEQEQEFLQPVFVFKGDDGFIGLVSAVDPQYMVISK